MNLNAMALCLLILLAGCDNTDNVFPDEWQAMSEACKPFGGIGVTLSAAGFGKLKVKCANNMIISIPREILLKKGKP